MLLACITVVCATSRAPAMEGGGDIRNAEQPDSRFLFEQQPVTPQVNIFTTSVRSRTHNPLPLFYSRALLPCVWKLS